jgi:hypothetical protein
MEEYLVVVPFLRLSLSNRLKLTQINFSQRRKGAKIQSCFAILAALRDIFSFFIFKISVLDTRKMNSNPLNTASPNTT